MKSLQPAVAEIMPLSVGQERPRAQTRTLLGTQTTLDKHAAVYYSKPFDTHKDPPINGACETALRELTSDAMLFTSGSVSN